MERVQRVSEPELCDFQIFSIKYFESGALALEPIFYYLDLEAILFSEPADC